MSKQVKHSLILLLTSVIWGISFVSQSSGGDAVGPYTFNSVRSFIGGFALLIAIKGLDAAGFSPKKPKTKEDRKYLLIGGFVCGLFLCLATNLQQLGIYLGTASGKAGFLTACYIILVPILGLFLKKKCGLNIWVAVAITVAGLYLLCMKGSLTLQLSDTLVIICSLIFAGHILVIDHFSPVVDGVRLSCIQFFVCGIITAVPMIVLELAPSFTTWCSNFVSFGAIGSLLYAGVMSCGVAYTLQIIGQDGVNPTVASLIMSLESVFSVIAGWIILGEKMGPREILGCALIFGAIILAQINFSKPNKAKDQ